jgi:hypothetical protein
MLQSSADHIVTSQSSQDFQQSSSQVGSSSTVTVSPAVTPSLSQITNDTEQLTNTQLSDAVN